MDSTRKKSSARSTTTSRQRHSPYTFFTDRDLDGDFYGAILRSGVPVERHDDHFTPNTIVEDHEWISLCAARGWVGLTHDKRIRYNPLAVEALMWAGAHVFCMVGKATHLEHAINFLAAEHLVKEFLDSHPEPFIARVYLRREGVKAWLTYEEWLRWKGRQLRPDST